MFQHTAARRRLPGSGVLSQIHNQVSTHSRPKAAASNRHAGMFPQGKFQHTAARRRLPEPASCAVLAAKFQHTAARRRLLRGLSAI